MEIAMLELRDISFAYGGCRVLEGVNINFSPGELCALVGRNGCGKTTLARLMARQASPLTGSILLDGVDISSLSGRELARRVSLFPQSRLTPDMAVGDYVAYGRYPYAGLSMRLGHSDIEAVREAMELTGVTGFEGRRLAELSGGERQLVYLAMQIAQGSDFMILDEPASSLDAANCFAVFDVLSAMALRGRCVVVIIHDISFALSRFPRVAVMDGGRIIYDGSPCSAVSSGAIESAFGVICEAVGEKDYIIRKKDRLC